MASQREQPGLHQILGAPADARLVIINADDLGMCAATTAGCLDAVRHGVATSTSFMVPCPSADTTVPDLGGLDVGVHLTLTCEWTSLRWGPLTDAPTLTTPDGGMWDRPSTFRTHADLGEARVELRAQVERACEWGVDVTHLDAHMYIAHDDPDLLDAYLDLAVEYAIPVRLSGSTSDPDQRTRNRARERGVLAPDHFIPLPAMGSREPLLAALGNLAPGVTEFHAHPAIDTPELRMIAGDWAARVDDHRLLCEDVEFQALLEAHDCQLIGHREIREAMRSGY